MLHIYRKEIVSNAFIVGGRPVPFEVLDGNRGVIALDDSNPANRQMIDGLNQAVIKGRGGILKISAFEYSEIKKKHPFVPSEKKLQPHAQPLRVAPTQPPRKVAGAGRVAGDGSGGSETVREPVSPMAQHLADKARKKSATPPVGRASRVKESAAPELQLAGKPA